MAKVIAVIAGIVIIAASASVAYAQAPLVQVMFDQNYIEQTKVCTPGTIDSAYVVAFNFNIWMTGIEYGISYPLGIAWLGDSGTPFLSIGSTPNGITSVWQSPQSTFSPFKVATIKYFCSMCNADSPIVVTPHPISGALRATRYPDLAFVYAIGMTSIFCPDQIPVESTTWGQVKALYDQ